MFKEHEMATAYMRTSLQEQRRGVSDDALAELGYGSHQDTLELMANAAIVAADKPKRVRELRGVVLEAGGVAAPDVQATASQQELPLEN